MKRFAVGFLVVASVGMLSAPCFASEHVNGYTRRDGTYVQPYERSSRDNTVTNNYSYQGNVNPSTGTTGTNNYTHDTTSPYYTGADSHGHSGHSNSNSMNNSSGIYGNE